MKVTTILANIRYSQDTGKGAWKAVEIGAEATVDQRERWDTALATLYADLGGQLKALWANGTGARPRKPLRSPLRPLLSLRRRRHQPHHRSTIARPTRRSTSGTAEAITSGTATKGRMGSGAGRSRSISPPVTLQAQAPGWCRGLSIPASPHPLSPVGLFLRRRHGNGLSRK